MPALREHHLPQSGAEERKADTDRVGGRERQYSMQGLGFLTYALRTFHFGSSKSKGLLRMKDALHVKQYSALQIRTTALKKSV